MVNIGDPAPNFSGNDIFTDQDWSLTNHQGKVVLIAFNGIPWCAPCRFEVPVIQELWDDLQGTSCFNYEFVLVNSSFGQLDEAKDFLSDNNISIPFIEDSSIDNLYEVTGVPTVFILDKDHKICAKMVGASPPAQELKDKILNALKECGLNCRPEIGPVYDGPNPYVIFHEAAKIIVGIAEGGGGIIFPKGPVPPRDPLRVMNKNKRDLLTAFSINQLANQISDIGLQRDLELRSLKAMETSLKQLVKKAELKPAVHEKDWMPLPKDSHECS